MLKPFTIETPRGELIDLRERLVKTRWPHGVSDEDWYYGTPLRAILDLTAYWQSGYDWHAQERHINRFANRLIDIDGTTIHFVQVRGKGPNPMPLLLTHGWPSTFYEMLPLAQRLADPAAYGGSAAESFDVVVPSVPGHGYSDKPIERGFADRHVAALFVKLMAELGYERFGAHAYDLGASITGLLCIDFPEHVIGYHTTSPANPAPYLPPDATFTPAERDYRRLLEKWYIEEGGYAHLLGTRPQSIAVALNDSPVGLAAWILEKWHMWTLPPSGDLFEHFSRDDLLTTVMIYWLTQTIGSANRYYREEVDWPGPDDRITVPVGVALTATQAYERPPREYVERICSDIRHWVQLPRGGHFVALEEPDLLADSIRAFFRPLRD